jgi:hypothetical protein
MDDSSENEDIVFVPMPAPNAEQEKSIHLNASNDVVLDYNVMDKGLGCKGETGARRKVLPNLISTHSAASSSGDPTPGTHPTPSSSVSPSLNSTQVPISGANLSPNTGHFVQAAKKLSNDESLEANVAISRKKLQVSTYASPKLALCDDRKRKLKLF